MKIYTRILQIFVYLHGVLKMILANLSRFLQGWFEDRNCVKSIETLSSSMINMDVLWKHVDPLDLFGAEQIVFFIQSLLYLSSLPYIFHAVLIG